MGSVINNSSTQIIKIHIYQFLRQSTDKMGTNHQKPEDEQFFQAIHSLKEERNNLQSLFLINAELEQKYRLNLIEAMQNSHLPVNFKLVLVQAIQHKIRKEDLTVTVSVLSCLKADRIQDFIKATSPKPNENESFISTTTVKFEKGNKKFRKYRKKQREGQTSNEDDFLEFYHKERTMQGRVKGIKNFITKQLNKQYHPFRVLCKRFGDLIGNQVQKQILSKNEKQYQQKTQIYRGFITEFCGFLINGCFGIYRKWIIKYTGMQQKKYEKLLYSIVLNQSLAINKGYLSIRLIKLIQKISIPLNINYQLLNQLSISGHLHPKNFGIDKQLQIEGQYFLSIYELSALADLRTPSLIFNQFKKIKNSICADIDNYYQIEKQIKKEEEPKMYEINADNIMGIITFILSRISTKVKEVYYNLMFLELIFGEGIFYSMDQSSYMFSTIWGAIEYLQTSKLQEQKTEIMQKNSESIETNNSNSNNLNSSS